MGSKILKITLFCLLPILGYSQVSYKPADTSLNTSLGVFKTFSYTLNAINSKNSSKLNISALSGTNNYIQKSTGVGTLGNSIMYDSGAGIGIGTTNPQGVMDFRGGTSAQVLVFDNSSNSVGHTISFRTTGSERANIQLALNTGDLTFRSSNLGGRSAGFLFFNDAISSSVPLFYIKNNGNIGNNGNPQEALDITGKIRASIAPTNATDVVRLSDMSIVNTTTTALSSATLNSTYPNVIIGFRVICHLITGAPAIYTKATENGSSDVWLTTVATVTP